MPSRSSLPTPSVPRLGARRSTAELALDVAEALHATEATAKTLGQRLGEPTGRVRETLRALLAEGIVRQAGGAPGRFARFTLTEHGVEALAARGRFLGDVVVLFTDLVASTQMIAEHGELGAHERRLRHFGLLRRAVERAGGLEVKGLGDGLMVAFADPVAAARCALDMQRYVREDADGLGLRVGMQIGPVLREGEDLHGSTVITASRLCDRAESGETLVSAAVAELVESADGIGTVERGPQALKGLEMPLQTYALFDARERDRPTRRRRRSSGDEAQANR